MEVDLGDDRHQNEDEIMNAPTNERTSTPVRTVTRQTTNEVVKIATARLEGYDAWTALGDWQAHFTEAEIVSLLLRAADQAIRSKSYRERTAEQMKQLKALLKANPGMLDQAADSSDE